MRAAGLGVEQDYSTAVDWYHETAAENDDVGSFALGVMYENGIGVTQDPGEAASWYRKAAEQGYAGAQLNLGFMYYNGHGVTQDYVQAHMWWNIAATQGDEKARNTCDVTATVLTPAQFAEAKRRAREWWAKHQKK